jgi:hypothetical protein
MPPVISVSALTVTWFFKYIYYFWYLQFLNNVIINKTKVLLPQVLVTRIGLSCLGFIAPKTLNYLAFQSFYFERTWRRLFQKRAVRTKFDIYVFIFLLLSW